MRVVISPIGTRHHTRRRAALFRLALTCLLGVVSSAGLRAASAASTAAAYPYGYRPLALQRAYDLEPLYKGGYTGAGQTIAFIEIDGYSPDDLWRFTQQYHLPTARVTRYGYDSRQGGYRVSQRGLPPGPETTMDLEWAHALAPGATLMVYEIPRPTVASLAGQQRLATIRDALAAALKGGAGVISLSLGAGGLSCLTVIARLVLSDLLQTAAEHNTAVFVSSGDTGDTMAQCGGGVGTSYPASDPHVTSVGGTTLRLGPGTAERRETAWRGSGGGLNTSFRRASWQHGVGLPVGTARALPDVAFLADPKTGPSVAFGGAWHRYGGTSLGAPCWAAIWAIARQFVSRLRAPVGGGANPELYALGRSAAGGQAFHDITEGSNGTYSAGVGWDFVTGWGTPDAAQLVYALARQQTPAP